jgi:o-succinylbenzoate synthase
MPITRVDLYELTLPLAEPFIISGGAMTERRSLIVVLQDEQGHRGYGESPPFELPFYSEETLASARYLLQQVLISRIVEGPVETPAAMDALVRRGVRGNPFARAALETAAWDLAAACRRTSLAALLAEQLQVTPARSVSCGVALGIPSDRSLSRLRSWIEEALARGYRRVKIKVAPGWDTAPVEAAREVLAGTNVPLTLDANGAYSWPKHEASLRALDQAELLYFEQPLAPEEVLGHVRLSHQLQNPICLDETLRDAGVAADLVELDGPRVWNVKVHRVGGLSEVCRIYRVATEHGAMLWAGTMPESGIGSQAALAAAALPGFVYPSDLEPSVRWFGHEGDVIQLNMGGDGLMPVPQVSIEQQLDLERFHACTELIGSWHPGPR